MLLSFRRASHSDFIKVLLSDHDSKRGGERNHLDQFSHIRRHIVFTKEHHALDTRAR